MVRIFVRAMVGVRHRVVVSIGHRYDNGRGMQRAQITKSPFSVGDKLRRSY